MEGWKNGWKDGQTQFNRTLLATAGGPKKKEETITTVPLMVYIAILKITLIICERL